jgi:hypothetical protein
LYPPDLLQLWTDHRFISRLASHMELSKNRNCPTKKFDTIYMDILSRHPDLLFMIRTQTIQLRFNARRNFRSIFRRVNCSYRVFCPFLEFRETLHLPFSDGDSPVDFLQDPRRAGDLYCSPHQIAEELVLRWISHAKDALSWSDGWLDPYVTSFLGSCADVRSAIG